MRKVLLVEDEKNFGMVLKDYLRMNGFEVEWAENGELGMEKFRAGKFDLCIVDVMMPKKDGFTLSAEIRSLDKNIPLVFLTARGMKEDMIRAYRHGADDYIVKPFDSELLLLKIKAILSRHAHGVNATEQSQHQLGSYLFNSKLRILAKNGQEIRLSPKESALLQMLCAHLNDILPKEKALKEIWKEDNYFTGRSMDVYVAKLRKYLANEPGVEIVNLHGSGYSLKVPEMKV